MTEGAVLEAVRRAVAALGGQERPGQEAMAVAVAEAITRGTSLAVQAGTGTGKSLAYVVPAVLAARDSQRRVVIATGTLNLQRQLSDKDVPRVLDALGLGDQVHAAVLKGRQNYVCLHRARVETPDDDGLFEVGTGQLARQVRAVREWSEITRTGDRDEYPGEIDPRVWRSMSVTARECIGESRCSFGTECFSAQRRLEAMQADIVITNHALVALDAVADMPILPEHDILIIDEAHDFVDRVTSAMSADLDVTVVRRVLARTVPLLDSTDRERVDEAISAVEEALASCPDGRMREIPESVVLSLSVLRDVGRAILSALTGQDSVEPGTLARLRAGVEEIHDAAARVLTAGPDDVVWVEGHRGVLHVAPLEAGGVIGPGLPQTVIATSATLMAGGEPSAIVESLGLEPDTPFVDVGSPFEFARQGILYVAAHLPPPGRDGVSMEALDELAELIDAAGGRTLGLFSSWRGVERAAEYLRVRLPDTRLLVQQRGDSPARLIQEFADDEGSVLLGTVSLWQGIDVPGRSCILVAIDRIPFPHPDDPIMAARSERADARGGSGFMEVSVPRASLLLAQGAGRLIRAMDDRGVVAILDSRMDSARYGSAIRRAMPPLWPTTDATLVRESLRRLAG